MPETATQERTVAGFNAGPCDDQAVWRQSRSCLGTLQHRNRYNLNEIKYCRVMCDRESDAEIQKLLDEDSEDDSHQAEERKDSVGRESGTKCAEKNETKPGSRSNKTSALKGRGPCVHGSVKYVQFSNGKIVEDAPLWQSITDWLERCPWEEVAGVPVCNNCNDDPMSARGTRGASRQVVEATLFCCHCEEHFCDVCFQRIHSGGKRALHKSIASSLASPRFFNAKNVSSGDHNDNNDKPNPDDATARVAVSATTYGSEQNRSKLEGGLGIEIVSANGCGNNV